MLRREISIILMLFLTLSFTMIMVDQIKKEVAQASEESGKDLKIHEGAFTIRKVSKEAKYINHKCHSCHIDVVSKWEKTSHSKASDSLKPNKSIDQKDNTKNEKCLFCHTTGFKDPEHLRLYVDEMYNNVQCEACHGPGETYNIFMSERYISKNKMSNRAYQKSKNEWQKKFYDMGLIKPTEKVCKKCHLTRKEHSLYHSIKEKDSPRFEFKAYLEKIRH